ncbi:MAG TPA: alpha/beta fold hydrolase [Pyrinomonadaceae bacterium]|jgi:medium-chain acyl-[acyl-carrier-protein] hydrolase
MIDKNSWLMYPRPNPAAELRLFCFPYAGSSATIFHPWARLLPPEVELVAVQYPGRGQLRNLPPYERIGPLTQAITELLVPRLNAPFAFFGHSMGALVSFEVARALRSLRLPQPAHLFVSGSSAPHLRLLRRPFHNLPDPELVEELRQLNGTPQEVLDNPELLALVLPILRADFAVCDNYVHAPGEPLGRPLTAFAGDGDRDAGPDAVAAWRQHTTAEFALRVLPGDHFFLHSAQAELLADIARTLRRHRAAQMT